MRNITTNGWLSRCSLAVTLGGLALAAGCSSGGGSGDSVDFFGITIAAGEEGRNITLTDGGQTSVVKTFLFDIAHYGPFNSIEVDFSDPETLATLSALMHLHGAFPPGGEYAGSVVFYAAAAGEIEFDSECTKGERYGPFRVSMSGGRIRSVDPPTAVARSQTMNHINAGALAVCAVIDSLVDATLTVDSVPAAGNSCDEEPADIAGTWVGTFECDNNPGAIRNVELVITQSGTNASYIDNLNASYQGVVCGRSFSFKGGVTGALFESGTFMLNEDGVTASKASYYTTLPFGGSSRANCYDDLSRK